MTGETNTVVLIGETEHRQSLAETLNAYDDGDFPPSWIRWEWVKNGAFGHSPLPPMTDEEAGFALNDLITEGKIAINVSGNDLCIRIIDLFPS